MASFQIIVGSMLGGTEYVAEACQETLETLGHQTALHLQPEFSEIPHLDHFWLICTSTHGAGDYPDNIQPFISDLSKNKDDLSTTAYMVIGIGDSNYDTFCLAATNIDKLLKSNGCMKKVETKLFDMNENIDPEALAQTWISDQQDLF